MYPIKLSQTARPLLFMMVDATDMTTPETGLSPTVTLSKDGGAFGAPAGAVTEISAGWYKVAGNATDANTLGPLVLHATSAGAAVTDCLFDVVAYDPEDAAALGLTAMPLSLTQALDLTPTDETVGDALLAARAQGFGKWTLVSTALKLFAEDGTTVLREFTLDSSSAPTSRTPV